MDVVCVEVTVVEVLILQLASQFFTSITLFLLGQFSSHNLFVSPFPSTHLQAVHALQIIRGACVVVVLVVEVGELGAGTDCSVKVSLVVKFF